MAAAEPDFSALYRELGLDDGSRVTLDALKERYRRRVAHWHPDRGEAGADEHERLKLLNRRYSAALAFQRLHGFLPGAMPPPRPPREIVHIETVEPPPAGDAAWAIRRGWLFAVLAAGLIVLVWPRQQEAGAELPLAALADAEAASTPEGAPRRPAGTLRVGLPRAAVAQLLGEPTQRYDNDALWTYGPSWVQFDCDRLAGWYSSPLASLRLPGVHPGERVGLGPGDPRHPCAPQLPAAAAENATGSL